MDNTRFDALTKRFADPTTRRGTLRLLAGGLLGALLTQHGGALVRAQRLDSDQDGLFDDDEVNIYGTKPDVFDTDGDTIGDGQEICNQNQDPDCLQDQVHTNPLVNEDAAPPPPPPAAPPPPPAAPTCVGFGGACGAHSACCGYETPNVLCCFDANGAGTCTDVSTRSFLCPDPGVPAAGCPAGMIDCGGFCTDVLTDHGNCGFCGNACPFGSNCTNSECAVVCPPGQTYCGYCTDLQTDPYSCGVCHNLCDSGVCDGGYCFHKCWGWGVGCDEDRDCCSGDCGLDEFLGTGVCV